MVFYTYNDYNFYAPPAIKNLRGEYYLNGHWVIEFSRATPIAGTMLYYQRGAEGDNVPETIIGRGPTTEPLVVEVRLNTYWDNLFYLFITYLFSLSANYLNSDLFLKQL